MQNTTTQEAELLIEDLKKGQTLVAMLAPSFVVDFEPETIAKRLKEIGFDKVTEVTFGAKIVNENYHRHIQESEDLKIASACPSIVSLIRNRFPEYKKNVIPVVSPMVAMAKILNKNLPNHKVVFIGPCYTKKNEAKEFKEFIHNAITFKELDDVFELAEEEGWTKKKEVSENFDSFYNEYTKIYPLAGGIKRSLHYKNVLEEDEILVKDGAKEVITLLSGEIDHKIRFLDILFCKGGCLGGCGINSKEDIDVKIKKIEDYLEHSKRNKFGGEKIGLNEDVEDLEFSRKI